ncbi:secreted protein [Paenibacillus pini JCM 16418]|uniref:Secreted protein n=1 Tax=Paenibacillus pini JCM 16418 TaxID=1236976 RepID=W7YWG4_9BACL|nr:secreted protein [Paenibacillus pini JCM 16418]
MLDVKILYGIIKIHYEIPVLVFENMKKGVMIKLEKRSSLKQGKQSSDQTNVNKQKVDHVMHEFRTMLRATASLKQWVKQTMSHININKLDWSTNFSVGNAAHTAVATGVLWGIKTTLIGWLTFHVRMRKHPQVFVVPVFKDEMQFGTEITCVGQISLGYVIYAMLVLVYRIMKVKGGLKQFIGIYRRYKQNKVV